ncbi:HNH endonuclease [Runella salmonicolor]|uniref:HNH endonuclease n=1 Tax=Runella salmonicolor TaxID=2950278 RepID=A0ABT1FV51_9BACT|nr:HNH endonuclease signature motif containing protein [Runella salmonicolor]MCP1385643.1 HNH endonuclease [Runella salmonicolor]
MINVVKSQPAPLCLAEEAKKKSGDYKCGEVLIRVRSDFHNKCYICETKAPTTINVEHFKPHKRGKLKLLKFDWNNLFYVCGHCNNTKLAKPQYDDILNCINPDNRIVDLIEHIFDPLKSDSPDFKAQIQTQIVLNTVALLEEVYDGKTVLKKIEAENIIDALTKEMNNFVYYATGYLKSDDNPQEKRDFYELIVAKLKPETAFTAFKIWVVKSSPKLLKEFAQYLPQ